MPRHLEKRNFWRVIGPTDYGSDHFSFLHSPLWQWKVKTPWQVTQTSLHLVRVFLWHPFFAASSVKFAYTDIHSKCDCMDSLLLQVSVWPILINVSVHMHGWCFLNGGSNAYTTLSATLMPPFFDDARQLVVVFMRCQHNIYMPDTHRENVQHWCVLKASINMGNTGGFEATMQVPAFVLEWCLWIRILLNYRGKWGVIEKPRSTSV